MDAVDQALEPGDFVAYVGKRNRLSYGRVRFRLPGDGFVVADCVRRSLDGEQTGLIRRRLKASTLVKVPQVPRSVRHLWEPSV